MSCPATAGRVQCPLKTSSLDPRLPLADPKPSPAGPAKLCAQQSITIPVITMRTVPSLLRTPVDRCSLVGNRRNALISTMTTSAKVVSCDLEDHFPVPW